MDKNSHGNSSQKRSSALLAPWQERIKKVRGIFTSITISTTMKIVFTSKNMLSPI